MGNNCKEIKRTSQATLMRTFETLALLDHHYGISIIEIHKHFVANYGDKFAPSKRSVRRYIASLETAGFLIEKVGTKFRVNLKNSELDFSRLICHLKEETDILSRAVKMVEGNDQYKEKLSQKLSSLNEPDNEVRKEETENVLNLMNAIKNEKPVILRNYRSANGKTIRDRKVEPFGFTYRRAYVWAYDREDKKNKLFSTSRFSHADILDEKFMYGKFHEKGESDVFRIAGFKSTRIQLKLTLRAFNLLIEEYPLSEKDIERLTTGEYLLSTKVFGFEGVGRFIMGLPGEVRIVSPVKLKDYVCEKIKLLLI